MGTQGQPPTGQQARLDEQPPAQEAAAAPADRPLTPEEVKAQADMMKSVEEKRERTPNSELLNLILDKAAQQSFATQVVEAELVRDAFDQDWRLAKVFALSGQFSDIKGTTQIAAISTAMAKIQLGRSWGLTPGDSIEFIYFTNGRPAIMNELVAAKLQDAGWDWEIQYQRDGNWDKAEGRCTGCRLWIKKNGQLLLVAQRKANGDYVTDEAGAIAMRPVSVEFTKKDADLAQIWEKGKQVPLSSKWNFVAWPEDMFFMRCIGRFKKRHAPNVLRGARIQAEADDIEALEAGPQAGVGTVARSAREIMKEDGPESGAIKGENGTSEAGEARRPEGNGQQTAFTGVVDKTEPSQGRRPPVRPINERG